MAKTLDEHYGYLSDRVKLEQYQAAIDQLVRPEHVVLDLGCGSGLLGLMALRAGARKVLFVEEGAIIEVARQTVADAGFADKAEFFQVNYFELELPEPVDVALCDHVGYFGFDYGILSLLADAKRRFLKPDGILLPASIDLLIAPVESDECRNLVHRWRDDSVPDEYSWVGTPAANSKYAIDLKPDNLLSDPATIATLELGTEAGPFLSWQTDVTCTHDATLDGILGWFDCTLADGIHMSNSPAADDSLSRPQAFLPLDEPISVSAGQQLRVTIMARHFDNVIAWVVECPETGQRYSQTTFNGLLLDKSSLNQTRPDRVAQLSPRGRARQVVLSYCDGTRTIAEVESLVLKEHPELFPSTEALQSFIRRVLAQDASE